MGKNYINISLVLLLAFFLPAAANSDDKLEWDHILGPTHNCHSIWKDFKPDLKDARILWRKSVGTGYSGMVINDGRIYTQEQNLSGQYVICLDLLTGNEMWRTRYGYPWELDGGYPGTYSSPTYYKGKIYYCGCFGEVGCLDGGTGKTIWEFNMAKKFATPMPGFGYACTPLAVFDKIYLPVGDNGASVVALNPENGETIWKSGNYAISYCSCVPMEIGGRLQIVGSLENYTVGLDPETGRELWVDKFSDGYNPTGSYPIKWENKLLRLSPFLKGTRTIIFSDSKISSASDSPVMSNDLFSPVCIEGCLYGFDLQSQTDDKGRSKGTFKCLDIDTGKELWRTEELGQSSILVCGKMMIILEEDGTLMTAKHNPDKFELISKRKIFEDKKCWTIPALNKGYLLMRAGGELVCMNIGAESKDDKSSTPVRHIKTFGAYFAGYFNKSFNDPSVRDFGRLFGFCILIISLTSAIFVFVPWKLNDLFFVSANAILGVLLFPVLTSTTGIFTFTVPLTLFSLFHILPLVQYGREKSETWNFAGRGALIVFCLFCFLYFYLCRQLFFTTGYCFLMGMLPAAAPSIFFAKFAKRSDNKFLQVGGFIISFSVFFWASSIVMLLKSLG